jgi:hypothetical protein
MARIEKRLTVDVVRKSAERMQVWGWASVCSKDGVQVTDLQQDRIAPDELEKAVTSFMLKGGGVGDMHERGNAGRVIESVVITPEKAAAMGVDASICGWWVGVQCTPEAWQLVKSGARPGFSIQGSAKRRES